jgi:hypothetical protein
MPVETHKGRPLNALQHKQGQGFSKVSSLTTGPLLGGLILPGEIWQG